MMATDEQGKVIWQAEYDAWGKVITASLREELGNPNQRNGAISEQSKFNLALRLPGQWQDQATGLYYNYQRDYNPDTGKYLTPDPLGFRDGADPYAYVNINPLNKLDPLGLYQSDIHYYMTFFLAVAAGVDKDEARIIALATQYIDDNDDTRPLEISSGHLNRLQSYHFTQDGYDDERKQTVYYPSPEERANAIRAGYPDPGPGPIINYLEDAKTYALRRIANPKNPQLDRLIAASNKAPNRCAQLQFFGEYLHAFQDTFSHRDSNNNPIPLNAGAGHGLYGSHPDYTYNHKSFLTPVPGAFNWNYNSARTLQMQLEVFAKMTRFSSGQDVISSGKITQEAFEIFLGEFNAINEHEGDGYEKGKGKVGPSGDKIKKLQEKLEEWFGVGVINIRDLNNAAYNETLAAENRSRFLCEGGKPLDQAAYEGTILPSSCN